MQILITEFMDAAERRGHDIDFAVMVPHSALRVYVMGERAIRLEANEYRFYYTLAQAQFHAGQIVVARDSLDRARQLAADQPAVGPLKLPDGT